mmetsp:Transcript_38758/g.39448  ORF Transcript_38758/g.39448 Transcript_38758/m.39448 type:complete len:134 (-) Transcript_38758:90-491(-)
MMNITNIPTVYMSSKKENELNEEREKENEKEKKRELICFSKVVTGIDILTLIKTETQKHKKDFIKNEKKKEGKKDREREKEKERERDRERGYTAGHDAAMARMIALGEEWAEEEELPGSERERERESSVVCRC